MEARSLGHTNYNCHRLPKFQQFVMCLESVVSNREIQLPRFRVIQTHPGSLGSINYFFVMYDESDFDVHKESSETVKSLAWLDANSFNIAEEIDDEMFDEPIYVLHATANNRAEPSDPINELQSGNRFFQRNLTCIDSGLIAHCLAIKSEANFVVVRTCFHHWLASDKVKYDGPESWGTMFRVFGTNVKEVKIKSREFWTEYGVAIKKWKEVLQTIM